MVGARTNVSHWFRVDEMLPPGWARRSLCSTRPDLPWTCDGRPGDDEIVEMRTVCVQCPVQRTCAMYALGNGTLAPGGFYAGYWLPWRNPAESMIIREMRRKSKRALRSLVAAEDS